MSIRKPRTFQQHWCFSVVLELQKGSLKHELRADTFHLHQVQDHIVSKMESGVEAISSALDHVLHLQASIFSSPVLKTMPRSSSPRRPARPDIWIYSPEERFRNL